MLIVLKCGTLCHVCKSLANFSSASNHTLGLWVDFQVSIYTSPRRVAKDGRPSLSLLLLQVSSC